MNSLMKKKFQRSRLKNPIKLWEGCKYHFSALTTLPRALCSYGNSFTASIRLPRTAFLTLSLPPPLCQELQMSFQSFCPVCCSPGFSCSHCTLASFSLPQEDRSCVNAHLPMQFYFPSFIPHFYFFSSDMKRSCSP